jgi:hypothetical protein
MSLINDESELDKSSYRNKVSVVAERLVLTRSGINGCGVRKRRHRSEASSAVEDSPGIGIHAASASD